MLAVVAVVVVEDDLCTLGSLLSVGIVWSRMKMHYFKVIASLSLGSTLTLILVKLDWLILKAYDMYLKTLKAALDAVI
jgi:hypothetical protein